MTVTELIAELQKMPPNAEITAAVAWAKDTATSQDVSVRKTGEDSVRVEGWLANCGTELEISEEEDEDAE